MGFQESGITENSQGQTLHGKKQKKKKKAKYSQKKRHCSSILSSRQNERWEMEGKKVLFSVYYVPHTLTSIISLSPLNKPVELELFPVHKIRTLKLKKKAIPLKVTYLVSDRVDI